MFHTSTGMVQYQHTNTSKSGVWEFLLWMGLLQERSSIIYHIALTAWDIWLLHELFSTASYTSLIITTELIVLVFMKIILVSPHNTSALLSLYSSNNILKVFFLIWIPPNWFHVNLILHPFHFVIQQLSYIKLGYILLGIKLVSIYWMMNILKSLIFLIQLQIQQTVINFKNIIRIIYVSLILMRKIPSWLKEHLMNSRDIRLCVVNPRSILVYAWVKATSR